MQGSQTTTRGPHPARRPV